MARRCACADQPRRCARTARTRRWSSGAGSSSSFEKMLAMWASTVFGREEQSIADRLVRTAFGHEGEDFAFALGQVIERDARSTPPDELGDDLGIDDRAATGDASDRVGEVLEVVDTILEQVAHPAGAVGDQAEGERRVDILGQDEHADGLAMLVADRLGGAEALVGVGRWHPDVGDRDVRVVLADRSEEPVASPAWATTSKPASPSNRAMPSRRSTESSASTIRSGHGTGIRARIAAPDSSSLGMNPRTRLAVSRGPYVAGIPAGGQDDERRRAVHGELASDIEALDVRAGRCRAGRGRVGGFGRPRDRISPSAASPSDLEAVGSEEGARLHAEAGGVIDDEDGVHTPIVAGATVPSYRVIPDRRPRWQAMHTASSGSYPEPEAGLTLLPSPIPCGRVPR